MTEILEVMGAKSSYVSRAKESTLKNWEKTPVAAMQNRESEPIHLTVRKGLLYVRKSSSSRLGLKVWGDVVLIAGINLGSPARNCSSMYSRCECSKIRIMDR